MKLLSKRSPVRRARNNPSIHSGYMREIAPSLYARAFVESARGKSGVELENILSRFIALVRKNRDEKNCVSIIRESDAALRKLEGRRLIRIESARELQRATLSPVKKAYDNGKTDFETKINPDLVAGVRLIMDESRQLDESLSNILFRMFDKS